MSDPILDFIQSQNEERASGPYDPIAGFRNNLDKVSGADTMRGGPEFASEFESIKADDPAERVAAGFEKGVGQFTADMMYMKGAFQALVGNEEGARRAVQLGIKQADEASKTVGALDMAQEWEKFLDAPDFESFMKAAPATVGEVGLSALTSITGALAGVAIAAYTAPVSVPTATAAALTGAAGKKSLDKITKQLAFTHFTKDIIAESVKRAALKKIINNKKLELSERFEAQLKLNKLPKNSAKIRIRNRCEVSGRPHGVYRKLRISRIALRDMASAGKIPGITKSSW